MKKGLYVFLYFTHTVNAFQTVYKQCLDVQSWFGSLVTYVPLYKLCPVDVELQSVFKHSTSGTVGKQGLLFLL